MQSLAPRPPSGKIFILTGPNGTGKTRELATLSKHTLDNLNSKKGQFCRMLCLSGTILDRFPNQPLHGTNEYLYFGWRSNSNMFSVLAPFRRLIHLLLGDEGASENRRTIARDMLAEIDISAGILLRFRRGRNSKEKLQVRAKNDLDIIFDLRLDEQDNEQMSLRLEQLRSGLVHLDDLQFTKSGKLVSINGLSSGERSYILVMLSLAFGLKDKSLILFDEPENSMHPSWQIRMMRNIGSTIVSLSEDSIFIAATHSPLIISAAKNPLTYVCDLSMGNSWVQSNMYGRNADSILRDQFRIKSSRSLDVLLSIQKCLCAAVHMESDPDRFRQAADALLSQEITLSPEDPLASTLGHLIELRRVME